MAYEQTIATVRQTLQGTFAEVDTWFDRSEELRGFRPARGWSINLVLEHISLTNHFLMLTLRKWIEIALRRAEKGNAAAGESDLQRLEVIGQRGSFGWPRPEHMEPTGQPASGQVRATLQQQVAECLVLLQRMDKGEGALCKITMTVNDLGKIDLYQWLYFLAQHARRHLQQLAAIEAEFKSAAK